MLNLSFAAGYRDTIPCTALRTNAEELPSETRHAFFEA